MRRRVPMSQFGATVDAEFSTLNDATTRAISRYSLGQDHHEIK